MGSTVLYALASIREGRDVNFEPLLARLDSLLLLNEASAIDQALFQQLTSANKATRIPEDHTANTSSGPSNDTSENQTSPRQILPQQPKGLSAPALSEDHN